MSDRETADFFRKFGVEIVDKVSADSVLGMLHKANILTQEEADDKIKNLETRGSRREFVKIMTGKDSFLLPIFVNILESETSGQTQLISRMREHIGLTIPPQVWEAPQNVPSEGVTVDLGFAVTYAMVPNIRHVLTQDEDCVNVWLKVKDDFLSSPNAVSDKRSVTKLMKEGDESEAISQTLKKWVGQNASNATFQVLLDILRKYGLQNAIESLMKNLDDIR